MEAPDPVELVRLAAAHYRFEANRLGEAQRRWGLRPVQYWQLVNAALEDPCVALAAPVEVARLLRQRDARQRLKRAS